MADTKTDMLPICLPVLPLRGVVMFPQTILNLDVAREKSARAIEHAMKHNRKIFIVAQKDVQQEDPSFSDLYRVGVVAEIQQGRACPQRKAAHYGRRTVSCCHFG